MYNIGKYRVLNQNTKTKLLLFQYKTVSSKCKVKLQFNMDKEKWKDLESNTLTFNAKLFKN